MTGYPTQLGTPRTVTRDKVINSELWRHGDTVYYQGSQIAGRPPCLYHWNGYDQRWEAVNTWHGLRLLPQLSAAMPTGGYQHIPVHGPDGTTTEPPAGNRLRMTVPASIFLKANGTQPHWAKRKDMVKALRLLAARDCRLQDIQPRHGKTLVVATIGYPTRHKADPANAAPTVKPIIDGMTDAGIFPDDNSDHVVQAFDRDHVNSKRGHYTVTITMTNYVTDTGSYRP